jgi:hypothetical protein
MDEQDWDETEQIPTRDGYVRESGYARRHRLRQRRMFITLGLVVLALFFAFWYALSYYTSAKEAPATPRPSCVTPTVALPPSKVKLNVYNATTRTGLASATAKSLADRGFVIGAVDNDPLKKSVKGAVELRYGPAGKSAANVVARHLTSSTLVLDKRKDATVDVVLGNAWKSLGKVPPAPSPTCR